MRTGLAYWSVSLLLGALLWLAGLSAFSHPVYQLVVVLAALSWCGYVVWTPKTS